MHSEETSKREPLVLVLFLRRNVSNKKTHRVLGLSLDIFQNITRFLLIVQNMSLSLVDLTPSHV